MKVTQISIGRFHHFHLARQLEKRGLLDAIVTGYPRFKLKDEQGIPAEKIHTFPWLHGPYMASGRVGVIGTRYGDAWAWHAAETLDWYASRRVRGSDVLIALSGSGLRSGREMRRQGGIYLCDRASSHIRFQDEILRDEYRRWGLKFRGVDPKFICKEEAEYDLADRVTVPSEFVRRSFLKQGVAAEKLAKIPFGARLERFRPCGEPKAEEFNVVFVGQVAIRKGFFYLLEAFSKLRHPRKRLSVIGAMSSDVQRLLPKFDTSHVDFLGAVPNADLPSFYSCADVMVLPSIEEGLSYVQGEALACGCPVIATAHTGAEDLFSDGQEGFIVPIRSSQGILEKLELFAQQRSLRDEIGARGILRVKSIGGWDDYGENMVQLLAKLSDASSRP